ncbi:molybdate ABC transporter permease subunit [Paenibacillus marinisediminis]
MKIGVIDWQQFWSPIRLSVQVALLSSVLAILLGVAAAWWMSKRQFKGKVWIETLFMLPIVLPPTVIGFLLLVILGRNSAFGRFLDWLLGAPLIFTWWSAVIAAVVVAFPLVYQTMKTGFGAIDQDLLAAGRAIGANERQLFYYVVLPLTWRSFMTAYILGFTRSLGEFGATLMVAGNIPGKTQTLPTAIYVAVDSGNTTMAWAWALTIILISFLMLLLTGRSTR